MSNSKNNSNGSSPAGLAAPGDGGDGGGEAGKSHPEIERLAAFQADELSPAEAAQVSAHLAACRGCRDLLAEIASFLEPPSAQEVTAAEFERAAVWRALQPQLPSQQQPHRPPRVWGLPSLVAAALLAVVLGLAAWAAVEHRQASALRRQVAEMVSPRPNAPTYNVDPPIVVRSAAENQTVAEVPAGEELFTLVFGVVDPREFPDYRLDFVGPAGETVLSVGGLHVDAVGTLTLGLSRRALPAGDYQVRLYGAGAAEPIHEFPFQLTYR